jgi:hypothetical protein
MTVQNGATTAPRRSAPSRPTPPIGPVATVPEVTLSATDARAGQRVGLISVLVISTGLAVLAMTAFWVIALRHPDAARPGTTPSVASQAASDKFHTPPPAAAPVVPKRP